MMKDEVKRREEGREPRLKIKADEEPAIENCAGSIQESYQT